MDALLVTLNEIKKELSFEGTKEDLIKSGSVLKYCKKKNAIAKINPGDWDKKSRIEYTEFLVSHTRSYLNANPHITSWNEFSRQKDTRRIHKMLHEYGVKGELFPLESLEEVKPKQRSKTSLTMPEFYELCQIQFHFQGSFLSFKRFIQRQYGSFAEYCIMKGYDINSTKWENDETAIRVARKLGSVEKVKEKSASLYKYLNEKDLLEQAFSENAA